MKFKSQLITQASGSVGGLTFAHNSGGLYARARSIPTNPNSAAQQSARNALAGLASAWTGVLTATQRTAWEDYAAETPLTDALGDPLTLSGQQMYIRCNQPRIRAGLARVDAGPTTPGLAPTEGLAVDALTNTPNVTVSWNASSAWEDEDGAAVIVQASRSLSVARNFFKGPFRFGSTILGSSTTAPTSPTDSAAPFALTENQKAFARLVISRADGRLSPIINGSGIVTS